MVWKVYRISTLLKKVKLENRSIDLINYKEKCSNYGDISFKEAHKELENEKDKSTKYLKEALDII